MYFRAFIVSALFMIMSITPAFASSNEIVVTGTKTEHELENAPVKTIVIRTDELIEKGVASLQDAFKHIPGIRVKKSSGWGAKGQIVLRGFDPKHTLILLDGHRVNGGHSASVDLNSYPIEMIEKIEIVKGPGSVLYGSEAMGGVINIITKKAEKNLSGFISLGAGTRDTQNYIVNSGVKGEKAGALLTYSYRHTDGVEEEYDELKEHRASGSFDYDFSGSGAAYAKFLVINEEMEEDERTQKKVGVNPGFHFRPDDVSSIKVFGSFFTYDHETGDKKTDYTEDLIEAEINYSRLFFERHNLTLGSQFESSEREDRGKGYDADETTKSIFVSDEIDFSPFVAVIGVRVDSHDEWGEEYNPKATLMFRPDDKLTVRTSLGRGFNAPSLSKLYGSWKMGPYYVLPNKKLKPERSIGFDAGIDYAFSKDFKASLTFFKNQVEDLINSVKYKKDRKRYLKWVNVNEAKIMGAEAEIDLSIKDFSSKTSYTWMLAEDEKTGKELEERPRHKVDINLGYNLKNIATKLDLFGSWTGERFEDDDNSIKLDSYWTFDASISTKINKYLTVFARAENIFGEEDIEDEYDIDGRVYYAGIKGSF